MSFEVQLKVGKTGESILAKWFINKGFNILPIYEKIVNEFKGPTLFTADKKELICPDMLVFKKEIYFWVEVKYKTAFTWHRNSKQWVTGIDIKHYEHYLELSKLTPKWPICIMFLQEDGKAKDTPIGLISPNGLYGGELSFLSRHEHHRHGNWGKKGMVYWDSETLGKYEDLNQMRQIK